MLVHARRVLLVAGVQLDFVASGAIHAFSLPRLLTNLTAAAALLIAVYICTGAVCIAVNRPQHNVLIIPSAVSLA